MARSQTNPPAGNADGSESFHSHGFQMNGLNSFCAHGQEVEPWLTLTDPVDNEDTGTEPDKSPLSYDCYDSYFTLQHDMMAPMDVWIKQDEHVTKTSRSTDPSNCPSRMTRNRVNSDCPWGSVCLLIFYSTLRCPTDAQHLHTTLTLFAWLWSQVSWSLPLPPLLHVHCPIDGNLLLRLKLLCCDWALWQWPLCAVGGCSSWCLQVCCLQVCCLLIFISPVGN